MNLNNLAVVLDCTIQSIRLGRTHSLPRTCDLDR